MKYSQEQINELASKIDIVDYIGQTEELHRKGDKYFIKCPFHVGDDTPSLCIYPESNRWYCFGCSSGSSIFDWIMKKDNIDFGDSVKKVAKLTNSDLAEYEEAESITFLKELEKCQNSKPNTRIFDRQILDFQKDYLDKYSDELPKEWLDEGISAEAIQQYNVRIDRNANRIVYPVLDSDNNFIGLKGRTRLKTYKELGLSKYINYQKIGTIDYFAGWQQAFPKIIPGKSVIIFEGIKSCMKAWGWNIRNTVASETAALSDGQLRLLIKNGFSEVIIAWDSDQDFRTIITDPKINMLRKFTKVSVIRDSKGLLGTKEAPVDRGEIIFRELLNTRITI